MLEFFARRLLSPPTASPARPGLPKVAGNEVAAWEALVEHAAGEALPTSRAARRAWFARSRSATTPAEPCSSRSPGDWENWTASSKPNWPKLRAILGRRPDADEQAVDLLELLPLLTPRRLAAAPEPLLRTLFEQYQLQVPYHKPQNRATIRVALRRTTAWTAC